MILVIGGTGKVGQELLKQLADKKVRVRALVRSAEKAQAVKALGHEAVEGDVGNPAGLQAAFQGVDSLFLLTTAHPSLGARESAVVDAAKNAGVRKVVLLSSLGANAANSTVLAAEHGKSEDHLKASGLAYTILEPHAFMQNILNSIPTIRQGALYANFKDAKLAMVDTGDIAAVAVAALTGPGHEGRTYQVTGGEAFTYAQLAEKLTNLTGKKVSYVDVPSSEVIKAMTAAGAPEWLAASLAKMGENFAAAPAPLITDAVEKVAGKKPVTLSEFLRANESKFK